MFDSEKYEKSDFSEKMKKSLLDQKESAFLSKKLATIITDLEIDTLQYVPFAPLLQNPSYLALLQEYEFRSLLPKDASKIPKIHEVTAENIDTYEALCDLLDLIQLKGGIVSVLVNTYRVMILDWNEHVYVLDMKNVDVSDIIYAFEQETITLVTYDMKRLLWSFSKVRSLYRMP